MPFSTVVRPGGMIFVIGVNGFLDLHLTNVLLKRGYAVPGSARFEEKAAWVKDVMTMRHPSARFEIAAVPTLPLQAPSTKTSRVVMALPTSPVISHSNPILTKIERQWSREFRDVYAASKTQRERELWKFAQEQKPSFVLNTVLSDFILGPIFHAKQPGSTCRWVKAFCDDPSHEELLQNFVPYFINVEDIVLLQIAALTEEDVKDERLLGFAEPFNFNSWIGAIRKFDPSKPWPPEQQHDLSKPDTTRALGILKRYGRSGRTPFYESVRRNYTESAPGS